MNMHSKRFTGFRTMAATTLLAALLATLGGCNKAQDENAAAPPTTIGTVVDDSVLSAKVKSALLGNDSIKSLDIKVETDKGVVMLSGFADSATQIENAMTVAKGVEGVTSVVNKFSLKDGAQTIGHKIDDTVITTKVKAALLADETMKSLDVAVVTRNGEVQLSGFVNNATQLTRAVEITKGIEGAASVVNNMSLKK
jgi:hyperosmotically inducible periplasmic protein